MKTKEEITKILKTPYCDDPNRICSCCGWKRDINPTFEMCFRCHRRGCEIQPNGKRVRKCR